MPSAKRSSSSELGNDDTSKKKTKRHSEELQRSSTSDLSTSLVNYGASTSRSQVACTIGNEEKVAGYIEKVYMKNFMCHSALEVTLNSKINFIVGRNGSGKSAILAAVVIALGCKASITNRASSLKDFIKNGANSALVQVTLSNEGLYAYKPEVYGSKIIIARSIFAGSTPSSYKFKSAKGEIISTKREELEKIITAFNIQVDNPISVLNQDTARTFLATADPKLKYTLFMKATKLEDVDQLHAKTLSCEATSMRSLQNEIDELEKKVNALRKLEEVRREAVNLENEYFWALARDEEKVLANMQSKIDKEKESKQPLKNRLEKRKQELKMKLEAQKETKAEIGEMDGKVKDINERLQKATSEFKDRHSAYKNSLQKYKHLLKEKEKYKQDCNAVKHEVEKHRGAQENLQERKRLTEEVEKCNMELGKYDSVIKSTELEQQQLRDEAYELRGKVSSLQMDKKRRENDIRMKKHQLEKLKSETDNLSIYGEWMPRLVRRIEDCYKQNKFVRKPLGPLGSLVKVEDAKWTPAIEKELGSTCQFFAVHCAKDSQVLQGLFKELRLSRNPGILVSKFTDKLHNIHGSCVKAPGYQNIYDVLRISEVNAANALIDANGIEGILLIPTPKEAVRMMSKNVPKNCRKAITLEGDTYFPFPDYRMYAGSGKLRARFLQINKQDMINLIAYDTQMREMNVMIDKNRAMTDDVCRRISELRSLKAKLIKQKSEFESAMDLLPDPQHFLMLNEELKNLEKKGEEVRKECEEVNRESDNLKELSQNAAEAVKAIQAEREDIDKSMQKLQLEITNQKDIVRKIESKVKDLELAYAEHCSNVEQMVVSLKNQEKQTEVVVNHALSMCPQRLETTRPAHVIQNLIKDLKTYQDMVEEENGVTEEVVEILEEKKKKYQANMDQMNEIELGLKALSKSLGSMDFDDSARTLNVEIAPAQETERRETKSLSGGERSYSTVSFILSLWECVEPPFYFMDEFDVFMDKVNRRIVINNLIWYAQQNKKHQYVFLTPQDTSQITTSEDVTIYRLDDPERTAAN
ncbi:Structural maintenance of chromosomes protein 6 [Gryllus bimaculatus]|nr:Structural maintenance of chromosomes protein 6 [Gryllus bimaculatus]